MFHRTATLFALLTLCSCASGGRDVRPSPSPAAPAEAAPASRAMAQGRGYTVPVPSGFLQISKMGHPQMDSVLDAGGVVLAEAKRPALENAFLASLVVAPLDQLKEDPADPAFCDTVSGGTARLAGAQLESHEVMELKVGKTCQWVARGSDHPHRGAKWTIIPGPSPWMVVCNYDLRDRAAQAGCDQLVDGWRFTAL